MQDLEHKAKRLKRQAHHVKTQYATKQWHIIIRPLQLLREAQKDQHVDHVLP